MEQFDGLSTLMVKQEKELLEAFTDFETANKYTISNDQGQPLFTAAETGGNWLTRNFLKNLRPFFIEIRDKTGAEVLTISRPFRWYFQEIQVSDAKGNVLGMVKREISFINKKYSIFDPSGKKLYEIFGPLFKPWTFDIKAGERKVAKISKKWSGLLKEAFTDTDNFGVQFPEGWKSETKATILGAVFLIDFMHFEENHDN